SNRYSLWPLFCAVSFPEDLAVSLHVGDSGVLPEPQLVSHSSRHVIAWIDDADRSVQFEMCFTPGNHRAQCFRRIAFAVRARNQRPAEFGDGVHRRIEVSLQVSESKLADVAPGLLFLDCQISETKHAPVPAVPQQSHPGALRRQGHSDRV